MNTKFLAAIALGAFAVSAVPAAAAVLGPLSPAGGQSESHNGKSPAGQFGTFGGQSQNLVIEDGDVYAGYMTYEDERRTSLSRNGSDR